MRVRSFIESDRKVLRQIYLECRSRFAWLSTDHLKLDDFDHDTQGELIWVAIADTQPLGFVSAWEAENFVHLLFVHPAAAREGVGSALLAECLAHLGRPAELKCVSKNLAAKEFYLSQGWHVVAEEQGSDGPYLRMRFV